MKVDQLNKLPKKYLGLLKQIGEIAQKNSYLAFVVGGVVRDLYLGRKNFDFDIVVEGDGIDFAEKLSKKFDADLIKHERFQTATVVAKGGQKIDIATARKESYEYPGALPKVTPGRITDDLYRRDFSINAMAIDITPSGLATLIDFFEGLKDLRDKKIKVLHDLSFIDDPTRILRAIRFEQRFRFSMEEKTYDLMQQALKRNAFETINPTRIWQEIYLILNEDKPKRNIERLAKICGLKFIHPKLKLNQGVLKLFDSIQRNIEKNKTDSQDDFQPWILYFMALTETLKLNETKLVAEKFNLKRQEKKRIYSYKNVNKNFMGFLEKKNLRPSQIYIILEPVSYEALLLLKIKSKNKIVKKRIVDFINVYSKMRLSINGHDLNVLGAKLDSRFKDILDKTFYKKLDGELQSKKEELSYAKNLIENL